VTQSGRTHRAFLLALCGFGGALALAALFWPKVAQHAPFIQAYAWTITYPHIEVWVERFYLEWGEDFGWQREGDAIVLENTPHLKPIPLAREASVVPHARALDLLQHREFEALMDERLIRHILVTPTLWQGTVTLSQTQGTERFRLVIAIRGIPRGRRNALRSNSHEKGPAACLRRTR
jgi:hypothetical protein